jgi:hypothetical protein
MSTRRLSLCATHLCIAPIWLLAGSAFATSKVTSIAGGNQGQSQVVTLGFECLLAVQVFNGPEPAVGATVVFASPSSGASALMTDSMSSGSQLEEITDDTGMASVFATADVVPGSYKVTATLTSLGSGLLATPVSLATYPMTNVAIGESVFANGLEDPPALCGLNSDRGPPTSTD